jgi:branched-chain amino acid aminotransferase
MATVSECWTYYDGKWHEGAPPVISARTHGFHLGSSVFDGARAFEGVTPDLDRHCERVNSSAKALGLLPLKTAGEIHDLIKDGLKRIKSKEAIYIRPMYWAEQGGYMGVAAEPDSTRFLAFLSVEPMISPKGFSLTLSPFRRPTIETMPTNAKSGCLYPNNARAIVEARSRGFDNALVRDMLGNVCETATSNIFMVKDGVVMTPAPNGAFLSGITRSRVIGLLRQSGKEVVERALRMEDFLDADEIFATGNHSKVVPVIRIEGRDLQAGPVAKKARELYWAWAHS